MASIKFTLKERQHLDICLRWYLEHLSETKSLRPDEIAHHQQLTYALRKRLADIDAHEANPLADYNLQKHLDTILQILRTNGQQDLAEIFKTLMKLVLKHTNRDA